MWLYYTAPVVDHYTLVDAFSIFIHTSQKLAGASVLILANKQDLQGALSADEIAQALGLRSEQFAKRHWTIVGCSAVTGAGLKEGIGWIVGDIASRIFMLG